MLRILIQIDTTPFRSNPAQSIFIEMKLLPHKPAPSRLLAALFPFRIETLKRVKKHTSIKEAI
jgi:hypothetical protein